MKKRIGRWRHGSEGKRRRLPDCVEGKPVQARVDLCYALAGLAARK